jgi:hypothetical protein
MENYLIVELPQPKTVKALGNKNVEITKIEIFEIVDSNNKKTVTALCINHPTRIVLWSEDAYDTIGEWTTQNVIDRVLELYTT